MGRKYIIQPQADLYMKYRNKNNLTQDAAAAKADISVRSGREIESNRHHTSKLKKPRCYKTRRSPVDDVWASDLEPMLRNNPDLQPRTLLIYLQRTYLDDQGKPVYTHSVERTLQRKVARWLALNGKPKEIMFPQEHIPGQQALSDFSHLNDIDIVINGEKLKHMLYHFRLVYSKWSYIKIVQTGESMQALSEGLQEALFSLGGAPKEHRTDSLSAAFKNLSQDAKQDLTDKYEELCAYFNMTPTRNNKGVSHENGSVESSHGHIKNRIKQELILRGRSDFNSLNEYETWVHDIVKLSNKRNSSDFETEQLALQKLPINKTQDHEVKSTKVSSLSIINIKGMKYSIPSNLSGHTLTLHLYQNHIKAYLGSTFVFEFKRKYKNNSENVYVIDYRHVIHSLIKKPGAFRYCNYRNELLPNDNYRIIWDYIDNTETIKVAPKIMLRLLKLAAECDCESSLEAHVLNLIKTKSSIIIEAIENIFNKKTATLPEISCTQHDIATYDFIINNANTGEKYAAV